MEIKIPEGASLVLIQEISPWMQTGVDRFDYRPPMLVVGEEWGRIDRHQRGIVRANADRYEFTGIVPSADHDKQKHVDSGYVLFGKIKYRHLESVKTTPHCVEHQQRLNELIDNHNVEPKMIVRDPKAAERAEARS